MVMPGSLSAPARYRFSREVIAVAVRWYLRYGLSYRDVEELLAERGASVDHVTVYRWCCASRGSSSTPPNTSAMFLPTVDSSTRPTTRSPDGGPTSTEPSTNTAKPWR
jgi:hypothetical protein